MKPVPDAGPRRSRKPPGRRCGRPGRQRGVTILVVLMALGVMLVAAVALVKAFNSTLFTSGNLAFKRDLVNQAERASAAALAQFDGALATPAARANHLTTSNYRASMYTPMAAGETGCPVARVNAQGIPCALLSDAGFATAGVAANDITVAGQGVRVRWIVDRLCNAEGAEFTLGSANCSVGPTPDARGGSASELNAPTLAPQVTYRLSVRVDGPRDTQAFFQSTFAL